MPNISGLKEIPRKEMHIFYVLDTSGSMNDDSKIQKLNECMEECTEALKDLAKSNADAILKIAVLEFNSNPRWITSNGAEALEDFMWSDLKAGGTTDIGAALKALNSKLSKNGFLNSMTGALMPVIIFMTDGHATDDYLKSLIDIRTNKWFSRATKIGFAFGEDADIKMMSSIVGNSEAVIKTGDMDVFRKLMRFVSVTSSLVASQSSTTLTKVVGSAIVKIAHERGEMTDDESVILKPSEYNHEYTDKGHVKCNYLKSVRKKIADANLIPYELTECHHSGKCLGTCPACDAEIQYLDQELQKKKNNGETIKLSGLLNSLGEVERESLVNDHGFIETRDMGSVIIVDDNAIENTHKDPALSTYMWESEYDYDDEMGW